ncbi:hemophore [Mycobacterium sp.]|uniref:hemophore n=1 Tax=Mycobacterium sp. TaxID=1785 RepID=UPI003BAF18A3
MTSQTVNTAALRRRLLAILAATGLSGATAAVLLSAPAAVGASDPCAASEMARTISNVARSAGDYLDGHPETNQAMTSVMQTPAGPQSVSSLKGYFDANPKAASDLQTIASPLAGLSSRCKMSISLPQVLGFMQSAQGAVPGGLPGGMPSGVISGVQNPLPGGAAAVPGAAEAVPGLSAFK